MAREQVGTPRMEKRQRRQAAKEARQAERAHGARKNRIQRLVVRSALLLIIAGLVGGLGWWIFRPKPGTYVPSQGNTHVVGEAVAFRYASDPPTSGPHSGGIAPWGIHERSIPKALQIHNLEDGGVLVQYNCTDCDDLVRNLKDIVRRYPDKVILAPYAGMKNRIALTAWSYIDAFDQFDEPRILRFIDAHRGIDHHALGGFGN
ncbi:MAG: DUF3105 domain-containing protein [candidate division NC10 bacterium]|nr:DUF3105 domain-containing protein [candidate division NC10 bacterium]